MTGAEIIKGLECCAINKNCNNCPYFDMCFSNMGLPVMADALALIKNLYEEEYKWRECAKNLRENCKKCISKQKQVPKPRFQGRCAVCDLDLNECDWGDENWCLSDNREENFRYCPRCGQRIDWKHDDYYDHYDPDADFEELLEEIRKESENERD